MIIVVGLAMTVLEITKSTGDTDHLPLTSAKVKE